MTDDHLARAKDYIARGEDYYRKAAKEIAAARSQGWTWPAISRELGRAESWVRDIVAWATTPPGSGRPTPFAGQYEERMDRAARTAMKDPEQRRQVIASLPSEQIEQVIEDAHNVAVERVRAKQAERTEQHEPTARDLMGTDPFDPSESWADTHIIRVREKAHTLRRQVEKWGVVLGSMTDEQAFEYLQETERNIAEVRVALQERLSDRARSEV